MITAARPPGIDSKLRHYYTQNPDEEMSYRQIEIKFGVSYKTAKNAVYRLALEGFLEHAHVVRRRDKGIARKEPA